MTRTANFCMYLSLYCSQQNEEIGCGFLCLHWSNTLQSNLRKNSINFNIPKGETRDTHTKTYIYKYKSKVFPRRGREGPEGKQMYSPTFPSTSELDGSWIISVRLLLLYPQDTADTHCIGDWEGPRAYLDGCRKSRPHQDSIPESSSP